MKEKTKLNYKNLILLTLPLLLCLGGCGNSTAVSSEASIVTTSADKVILDCDMGYVNDDAFALMLLLQADKMSYIELRGGL